MRRAKDADSTQQTGAVNPETTTDTAELPPTDNDGVVTDETITDKSPTDLELTPTGNGVSEENGETTTTGPLSNDNIDLNASNESEEKVVPEVEAAYVSFAKQYFELATTNSRSPETRTKNADQAIKSLNNFIKALMRDGSNKAFGWGLNFFSEAKDSLTLEKKLQSIATLSSADRAVVEVVTTIFHVIMTKGNGKIDLEKARAVVKNDKFINWCAKKLAK